MHTGAYSKDQPTEVLAEAPFTNMDNFNPSMAMD